MIMGPYRCTMEVLILDGGEFQAPASVSQLFDRAKKNKMGELDMRTREGKAYREYIRRQNRLSVGCNFKPSEITA